MKTKTVPVESIVVGQRFRKDVGDVDGLAESIKEIGLLHPVVVTPDLRLIAGFRRLTACKKLGWKTVPVRLLDIERVIDGEFIENVARKDFTLSEIAAIARELRPRVEADAQERRRAGLKKRWPGSSEGESCPDRPAGKTRDIIARHVGLSGRSLDKIEAITTAAAENPARYGPLKEQMDKGGKNARLNRLYLELRHLQEAEAAAGKTTPGPADVRLHHGDFRLLEKHVKPGTARLIVADPPWGRDAIDYWLDIAALSSRLLMDGGLLVAFPPLMFLPPVVAALGQHLVYQWTVALFRGDPAPLVIPQHIMNGWRPLLLYSKGKTGNLRIRDALNYARTTWKKKFHPWEQNPDELRYLVEHLTQPGDMVVDFFGGSFGAAVVCRETGRRYHGADTDMGCVHIGRKRVQETVVSEV